MTYNCVEHEMNFTATRSTRTYEIVFIHDRSKRRLGLFERCLYI